MIDRYTLPEMGRVWSEAHKYELWCRVETLVLEAHARAGTVPASAVAPVRSAPPPTPEAVAAIEAVTEHDVIAFLTAWADNTEPRSAWSRCCAITRSRTGTHCAQGAPTACTPNRTYGATGSPTSRSPRRGPG